MKKENNFFPSSYRDICSPKKFFPSPKIFFLSSKKVILSSYRKKVCANCFHAKAPFPVEGFFCLLPKDAKFLCHFLAFLFSASLGSMRQCCLMGWKVNRAASFGAALSVKRGMITS